MAPHDAHTLGGITPADAGTSLGYLVPAFSRADHPRGCGDKSALWIRCCWHPGSPPRMRGQGRPACLRMLLAGITPADAGTSPPKRSIAHGYEDHPRGCGDKFILDSRFGQGIGSPPRMRGQAVLIPACFTGYRITPADAGTSLLQPFPGKVPQDHPRGCGDKSAALPGLEAKDGSPPRMRGQV